IKVNVGLVTCSLVVTEYFSTIPLTRVVFPAPNSPCNKTSLGGASSGASWRPKSMVSSGERVTNSRSRRIRDNSLADAHEFVCRAGARFAKGVGQMRHEIGSQHGAFVKRIARQVASQTMQINGSNHRQDVV